MKEILLDYINIYRQAIKDNVKNSKQLKDPERLVHILAVQNSNYIILERIKERLEELNKSCKPENARKNGLKKRRPKGNT